MPMDSFSSSASSPAYKPGGTSPSSLPSLDDALENIDKHVPFQTVAAGQAAGSFARESLPDEPDPFAAAQDVLDEAPYSEEADPAVADASHVWEAILQHEFQSKDRNGDGFLSMKEITIKELLELDVDHNGFISFDEFFGVFAQKSEKAFVVMDLDRDGRLKLTEFARGTATPEQQAIYARYASDPVLGLTLDEYRNFLAEQRSKKR